MMCDKHKQESICFGGIVHAFADLQHEKLDSNIAEQSIVG